MRAYQKKEEELEANQLLLKEKIQKLHEKIQLEQEEEVRKNQVEYEKTEQKIEKDLNDLDQRIKEREQSERLESERKRRVSNRLKRWWGFGETVGDVTYPVNEDNHARLVPSSDASSSSSQVYNPTQRFHIDSDNEDENDDDEEQDRKF